MLSQLHRDVQKEANLKKAVFLQRFFKTGKGEYAEGDVFLGLTVPQSRKIVSKYKDLPLSDCIKLLHSKIHEERLIALLILVYQFTKGSEKLKKEIYDLYLANTKYINNWDLVDLSVDKIVGGYLTQFVIASTAKQSNLRQGIAASPTAPRNDVLIKLAKSKDLWERRISIIATFAFIKVGRYEETFRIADILLSDRHDLIHKATGWMLREVGKRISEKTLEEFLKSRYKKMPRTMLRYAIERFEEGKRKKYLLSKI